MAKSSSLSTTPEQKELPLRIAAEREVDGVEMGVLSNGTSYLTIRGLARMCGVDHSVIVRVTDQLLDDPEKPRARQIRELIKGQGGNDGIVFFPVEKNGVLHHTIPDKVCMAILEYYAFEARGGDGQALKAYRALARKGFRDFIYAQVGYNPSGAVDVAWQQYQDRVSLVYDNVPAGYFCVFKEIAEMFVTLLQSGAKLGNGFIPDISVGQAWGKHWTADNLDNVYGMRRQFHHNYPDYFPQSASNPQPANCYPDDALPEFRRWMREHYLTNGLPKYLVSKVKAGQLEAPAATIAVEAFKNRSLPAPR